MKKSIGLYLIPRSEKYEHDTMLFLWHHIEMSRCDYAKLQRYIEKLCQWRSEGIYDHLKALDLIFYAVDSQRKKMPEIVRPTICIAWQLTRQIVRDLENKTFKVTRAELDHFWEQETDQANAVFEKWWEMNKKGLTKYAQGGYNVV